MNISTFHILNGDTEVLDTAQKASTSANNNHISSIW